eukprot:Tamp_07450.p1 GENE.Tamp_07450~~Tamp_07450.p1  ORF type:complete len:471 (-),score=41.33 Tamp_07450:902-2314(-)
MYAGCASRPRLCRLRNEVSTDERARDGAETHGHHHKHELSFDVHEKSITRKLTVQCPARFSITQNQDNEQYWITSDHFRKGLDEHFHSSIVRKNIKFCRMLRDVYQVPRLYCRPPRRPVADELGNATEDLQSQPSQTLCEWLHANHLHKKHAWARKDGASPRTQCWEPTILARQKTAEIWVDRLAADGGVKMPADYLQQGAVLPPRRHTMENRSHLEAQPAVACGSRRSLPDILGAPSPRRFGGNETKMGKNESPRMMRSRHSAEVAILRDRSDLGSAVSSPGRGITASSGGSRHTRLLSPRGSHAKDRSDTFAVAQNWRAAAPCALRVATTPDPPSSKAGNTPRRSSRMGTSDADASAHNQKHTPSVPDLTRHQTASGLRWKNVGTRKPIHGTPGLEITNARLAAALARKNEFSAEEWTTFGVYDLHMENFIKSGGCYFQPVKKATEFTLIESWNLRGLELERSSMSAL